MSTLARVFLLQIDRCELLLQIKTITRRCRSCQAVVEVTCRRANGARTENDFVAKSGCQQERQLQLTRHVTRKPKSSTSKTFTTLRHLPNKPANDPVQGSVSGMKFCVLAINAAWCPAR